MYAESPSDVPYDLKTDTKEKFLKSVMLSGGISYHVLFPRTSPIFVDEWLESIRHPGLDRSKTIILPENALQYLFDRLWLKKQATKELMDLQEIIFHDDQDQKQRTQMA